MELNIYNPVKSVISENFGNVNETFGTIFGNPNTNHKLNESAPKVPLIILVFACATIPRYRKEIETIQETWGTDAKAAEIPVFYFLGEEETDLQGSQYIYLKGVKNDYRSADVKQFLGYLVLCTQLNPDTIFCIGSDTFINIPKLKLLASYFNPEKPILVGNDGFTKQFGTIVADFLSGGGGLLTTRETHRRILPYCFSAVDMWDHHAKIFRSKESGADIILSFLCHLCEVQFIQCKNIHHCNYKSNDPIQGPLKPSEIVTCHNMSPNDFFEFHSLLKENNYFM